MSPDELEPADHAANSPLRLPAERLYRPADLSAVKLETTADLQPIDGLAGQQRALDAVRFGSRVAKPGFNLFAIGSTGARMHEAVEAMLRATAADRPTPSDWVYVNNFAEPHRPCAIELPAGRAPQFRDAMRCLIEDLKAALPVVFEGEDYQTRRGAIDEAFQKKQADAFAELRGKAEAKGIVILRTPLGFALAPARNGQVVPPDEFNALPEAQKRAVQEAIQGLEKDLERIVRQIPSWEKERRDELRKLNRDTAKRAVSQPIDDAKAGFTDIARVVEHVEAVRTDLVENIAMFVMKGDGDEAVTIDTGSGSPFDRYEVNVLVTQAGRAQGQPIVQELHPTLSNLTGRIEYLSRQGALVTNFRLIKAGAMHRANGGYLLLDARSLLTEPFSWTALKRALRRREIVTEDVGRFLGLTSTVSLEPDPIPLDVKVILFGDRLLYYLLAALDPELGEHFKVLADFEDDIDRSAENEAVLARLIATIARHDGLRAIDRDGVALVIEHAARVADHAGKLTLLVDQIRDLVVEADFWAGEADGGVVSRADVQRALDERVRRNSRLRDRARETILQDVALIDTTGARIGQINGLSVIELGGFRFGRPTRITCRVRPGRGQVVDIEREVKLGGPVHSKGVLILSGFLAGRYALDTQMSLYASLVFEQSYAGVEGDSASSAELYALLSALAGIALRQDIAVTGSVNQHGEIQAIGGVNEKIEGFFDICKARGLTGTQGVAIPKANVQHLMLRRDVIDACAEGRFGVYAIATVDEGISLLAGRPAGERGADGRYPADTVNGLVEERLRAFASIRRRFDETGRPLQEGAPEEAP
ncbi:AAA family ATPase [Chelatococcus sp. SYSU_G07232]|uniref:endopeptidase La n=1 Tax=Chelatococcus albus TaxID=3047466 RepID=A0ABT7AFD3_9HYPH|nr:AAA family ATPase [Chelatococcus sp. SYSU_G07232]MDJ1158074.1 AAA family ATPase [Chelatococcus sp. SYSU_G07232]